jgi:hypothetical protein
MSEPRETPVTASVVVRMTPLWQPDRDPPVGFAGDLEVYADGLVHYIAEPLARFADIRGGDCFVAVVLQQGDRTAGIEYRDGEFAKTLPDAPSQEFLKAREGVPVEGSEDG